MTRGGGPGGGGGTTTTRRSGGGGGTTTRGCTGGATLTGPGAGWATRGCTTTGGGACTTTCATGGDTTTCADWAQPSPAMAHSASSDPAHRSPRTVRRSCAAPAALPVPAADRPAQHMRIRSRYFIVDICASFSLADDKARTTWQKLKAAQLLAAASVR